MVKEEDKEFTLAELIEWSAKLPDWQRDALRRILTGAELSAKEIENLVELAKAPHLKSSTKPLTPVPAGLEHIGPQQEELKEVRLVCVRDVDAVNGLASGPLALETDGVVLIYGANASGKSGFARIFRKACRSRAPGPPIRPNVYDKTAAAKPSAVIDYAVDGEPKSHKWDEAAEPNPELRTVNVFDSESAIVQLSEPNTVFYTPAVLAVFRSLAAVTDSVAGSLRRERDACGERPIALDSAQITADTAAGRYLSDLSADSQLEDLDSLTNVEDGEQVRLKELSRALAEDPISRAQAEEARGRAIEDLERLAARAAELLDDTACDALSERFTKSDHTAAAARAARQAFSSSSVLDGIGSDQWRQLWEAARRYSDTSAYKEQDFPYVADGAVCVLCEQEFSEDAARRMTSFEEFVRTDTQIRADIARDALDGAVSDVLRLQLPKSVSVAVADALLADVEEGQVLRRLLVAAKLRQREFRRRALGLSPTSRVPMPASPNLGVLKVACANEAARFRRAANAKERSVMLRERAEIEARVELRALAPTVRAEISRLAAVGSLDDALSDCKTQGITLKAGKIASRVVTAQLQSSFDANLLQIGATSMDVEVRLGAGVHGKHPWEVALAPRPEVPPDEVLSEGERTCVALAGFLAELETTGNRSAIVLDDPVTSLDHNHRKRIAERLVREAKNRQVVILTHDIVFLYMLRKYSRELGVINSELSLRKGYRGGHGEVEDGPPWEAMLVKSRTKVLRKKALEARTALKSGNRSDYDRRVSEIYGLLRKTWERAVEEVLFHEVILRFGQSVQTTRLAKVTDVSEEDVEIVAKEVSRCSDFVHDEAGAVAGQMPEVDVVEQDIKKLADWCTAIRKRREEA